MQWAFKIKWDLVGNRNKSQNRFLFRQLPWLPHELQSCSFVLREDVITLWLENQTDHSSNIYSQTSTTSVGTVRSEAWLEKGMAGGLVSPSNGWWDKSPICAKYQVILKIRKYTMWSLLVWLFRCRSFAHWMSHWTSAAAPMTQALCPLFAQYFITSHCSSTLGNKFVGQTFRCTHF